jgi:cytochrome c-type biogenesis protein CcmE
MSSAGAVAGQLLSRCLEYRIGCRVMRLKPRFLVGGGLIAAVVVYLIVTAIRNTAEYYLTVQEVAAAADSLKGQPLRIAGRVKPASVSWDPSTLRLVFTIVPIPSADGAKSSVTGVGASAEQVSAFKDARGQSGKPPRALSETTYAPAGTVKAALNGIKPSDGLGSDADSRARQDADPPSFVVVCVGQPKPDMFAENRDVIVEGRLTSARTIAAEQVLTSCPSKYTPESKK